MCVPLGQMWRPGALWRWSQAAVLWALRLSLGAEKCFSKLLLPPNAPQPTSSWEEGRPVEFAGPGMRTPAGRKGSAYRAVLTVRATEDGPLQEPHGLSSLALATGSSKRETHRRAALHQDLDPQHYVSC